MSTAYKRGADFERRAMKRLEEMGVCHVTRSAGSHTPVDIHAWWPKGSVYGHEWFIQAKSGKRQISRRDKMELVDLAHDCGAIPVLVTRGLKFEVITEGGAGGSRQTVDSD